MEGAHLEPSAFHGFLSGTLSPEEREAALLHLDGCSTCRKLLSALASAPDGDVDETIDAGSGAQTLHEAAQRTLQATARARRLDGRERDALLAEVTSPSLERPAPAPSLPPSTRFTGQKLGDYLVQELIATGGMGAVYRGVQPLIGKQVAIKILLTPGPAELHYAQRLLEEARTVNAIRHPNIIDIFNFGELPDGRPWLVMEYLDGRSLSQWVRERGPEVPVARILSVMDQIAAALEAVHAVGVVHRDLKPANVMLTHLSAATPRVKVLDFGFAKSRDAPIRTSPDLVLGTPGYMSPEQIQSLGATAASDLYSLGLLGYFMLTGSDAYGSGRAIEIMQQQIDREPPSLRGRPGVPDALAELIAELTRIDPSLRPASASEVRSRLKAITLGPAAPPPRDVGAHTTLKDATPVPPEPPPAVEASARVVEERPRRVTRRSIPAPIQRPSRWPWIVAVIVLGTFLGLGAFWLSRLAH